MRVSGKREITSRQDASPLIYYHSLLHLWTPSLVYKVGLTNNNIFYLSSRTSCTAPPPDDTSRHHTSFTAMTQTSSMKTMSGLYFFTLHSREIGCIYKTRWGRKAPCFAHRAGIFCLGTPPSAEFYFPQPKQPKIALLSDFRYRKLLITYNQLSDFEKVGWVSDSQLFAHKTQHLQGRLAAARHLAFKKDETVWWVRARSETLEGRGGEHPLLVHRRTRRRGGSGRTLANVEELDSSTGGFACGSVGGRTTANGRSSTINRTTRRKKRQQWRSSRPTPSTTHPRRRGKPAIRTGVVPNAN